LRVKNEKITKSNNETENVKSIPIERLKLKEFLTVKDAALILNSSIRTIYNLIDRKSIRAVNLSKRKTLIRRCEIDKLFEEQNIPISTAKVYNGFMKIEYYNLIEIQEKYKISESGINGLIRKYNLPKAKNGLFTLLEKDKIDKLLG
jgi:excisionase family DNA binding protein